MIVATSVTGQMRWTTPRWSVASSGATPAIARFEDVLGFVLRIGIQAEDLAEVRLARGPQLEPVGLRAAVRFFVRIDVAFAEPLEPHAAHEAAARVRRAAFGEHLVIDVDRRVGLGEQHALALPLPQQPGRARVAIVVLVIARLVPVEDQPHDVGRVLVVEPLLQLGVDHVVRRRDHVAQRADVAEVVANAAKGLDVGHEQVASAGREQAAKHEPAAPRRMPIIGPERIAKSTARRVRTESRAATQLSSSERRESGSGVATRYLRRPSAH